MLRSNNKEINILENTITIINQYFPELINKFEGLTDTRKQSYIKYKMKVIFIVRLMALMCEIKSMHELTREFNTEETIKNIAQICGLELEEIPHCDTISDVFKNINPEEIEEIRKKEYPRLKIIVGADALYAKKTIIDICKANGWKYIIRFKEGTIPTLYEEFKMIVKTENESKKVNYEYVTNIEYKDEKINVIKYKDKIKDTEFVYMTDLAISNKNIEETINIGRRRWKIENEGFNAQKNGTFDISHLYSKDAIAIKVHYLMIQIAHIIRQMLEKRFKRDKRNEVKNKRDKPTHEKRAYLNNHKLNDT